MNMEVAFTVGGQGTAVGGKELVVKVARNNQFVDEFSIDFRIHFRMTNFVMSSNYEFSHYFQIQKVDVNSHSGRPVRFGKEVLGAITMS